MAKALAAREPQLDLTRIPEHVAIIMDGNRRWAKARHLPTVEGHRRGILALREVTRAASDLGVRYLTVYGFSTENWKRDAKEISLLLELCVYFCEHELSELSRNNVRVNVIGRHDALPKGAYDALNRLVAATAKNTGLVLNLAVNYSARQELTAAVARMTRDAQAGTLDPRTVDEETIRRYLFTSMLPDPDILIRPGGEHRLSNFLLYQVAYTELYLSDVYWPDFSGEHLKSALIEFQSRQRRFGGA